MGRNLRRRSASVLVALVALIGGLVATAPSAVAAPAMVSGSVSRTSGAPLGGAGKVVFCPQSLQPGQWSFCSFLGGVDAPLAIDGTYTTALPAGDWYAVAIVGGRESAPLGPFTVSDDDVLTQDFSLAFGQVHGTVTDSVGGAIGNATVSFCGGVAPTCATPIQTPVQPDGTYVIALDEGTWTGTARAQAGTSTSAAPVTLVDGDDVTVDFQIGGGRIEGPLLDATGASSGASFVLQICSGGVCIPGLIVSGPTWSVDGVPAGTYTVWGASAFGGGLWLPVDPTPVVVGDGATTSGVALQAGGGSIVATVTDGTNPIAGASVQPCLQGYPDVPGGELCTSTANEVGGLWTMSGLPDGTYSVKASASGYTPATMNVTVSGGTAPQGEIMLSQAGTVTGQITGTVDAATAVVACPGVDPDPDFTAFPGVPCAGGVLSLASGSPLTYTINNVVGDLHLRAYTGSGTVPNYVVSGVSPVSVVSVPSGSTVSQNLFIGTPASISGTVVRTDGGSTGFGLVSACPAPGDPMTGTCAGGQYAFLSGSAFDFSELIPGMWNVAAVFLDNSFNVVAASDVAHLTLAPGDVVTCDFAAPGAANCSSGGVDDGDGVDEDPVVDGNGDGTPDAQQPHVTTLPAGAGGGDVTIAAPAADYTLAAVSAGPVPPGAPAADFPVGALSFTVNLPSGATTADVDVILPPGTNPTAYFKYQGGSWSQYSDVTIAGDTITLHLVDGGPGDDDGAVNGQIIDPGVPATGGYTFNGFRAPIDSGKINVAKAGQAVPVKWRITDDAGNPVSDPASFVRLRSSGGKCGDQAVDVIEAYAPGNSGLQYQGNGEWQYNWKTDKAWKGQCRTLTLELADGFTGRTADFQFK